MRKDYLQPAWADYVNTVFYVPSKSRNFHKWACGSCQAPFSWETGLGFTVRKYFLDKNVQNDKNVQK